MIAVYQLPQGTLFSAMLSLLTILIFRNRGSPGFDFTRPKLSTVFPLEKWPQVSIGLSTKPFLFHSPGSSKNKKVHSEYCRGFWQPVQAKWLLSLKWFPHIS